MSRSVKSQHLFKFLELQTLASLLDFFFAHLSFTQIPFLSCQYYAFPFLYICYYKASFPGEWV